MFKIMDSWSGRASETCSASFSPDGYRVVTTSWDNTAAVWDAVTRQKVIALVGHKGDVGAASFSPDGKSVVTASSDHTAGVWDAATGRRMLTLEGHKGIVNSASFSPDGKSVVTASSDHTAGVWDAATGRRMLTLEGHTRQVWSAAYSPDGNSIVTASYDKTAVIWAAATGRKMLTLEAHEDSVNSALFSPDGKWLVTSGGGIAIVWDAAMGKKLYTFTPDNNAVVINSASFSPDTKYVVTAPADGAVTIWDVATGRPVGVLAGSVTNILSVMFSPDGRLLLTVSEDKVAHLWDVATRRELCSLLFADAGKDWLAVTPEGYYQGSLAAEKYIAWRIPGKNGEWPRLVGPDQFRDTLYRPDLFRHLLAEGSVEKALAKADAERGKPTRPTDVARELTPVVLVTAPRNLAKVTQPEVRVEVVATSVGEHPVETLQLELNGQPEGRIQRVQDPKPGRVDHEWPAVQLRPGENSIRVVARAGGSRTESDPVKVTYLSRDTVTVRLRILAIGVGKFKPDPAADPTVKPFRELRKAGSDARSVSAAFARYGKGLYTEILPPKVLADEDATRENILDALAEFSEGMTRDDVGVIFYAGHGIKSKDQLYLAAHDTRPSKLFQTGVSATQLRGLLAGTKGRGYLFLDACYSGAIVQRSDGPDAIHEDIIRELRKDVTGTVIATACRGGETANEDEAHGGYFSFALVEGLSGKAQAANGVVYPKRLGAYVEDRLKEMTRGLKPEQRQRPYFDGSDELMDVPLVKP